MENSTGILNFPTSYNYSSIDLFRDKVESYIGNTKFSDLRSKRTGEGCTDLTLIFMNAAESSEIGQFINDGAFLLKAMLPGHAINAKLCSKALQMLGMTVPEMCILDNEKTIQNCYGSIRELREKPQYKNSHDLAFMTCVDGANLQDRIDLGSLFKLKENCWNSLLQIFGQVAVYDLLLANHDRFYRRDLDFDSNGNEFLRSPLNADSFINSGNIMISLDLDRNLEKVFCIDNGSCIQKKDDDVYLDSFFETFKQFSVETDREKFADIIFAGILGKIQNYKKSIETRYEKITEQLEKKSNVNSTEACFGEDENDTFDMFANDNYDTPEKVDPLTDDEFELIQSEYLIFEDKQYAISQLQIGINEAYDKLANLDRDIFIETLKDYLSDLYDLYPKAKDASEEFSNKIMSNVVKCLSVSHEEKKT